ncbi:hypothetical protein BDN71DRAFT_534406 [Pleurotus eryngii]|uniref:Uncharacterized protein n=1 Tax=Pleurotus eryngii TaxID=5323 RepID=A0A9P6DHD6_PLEER|nr:hypothetical protein BDN71DRAFT_534406 [Pleurotus eryngii]
MLRTSLAPHFKTAHLRFRRIATSSADIQALDKWIATPQRTRIHDTLSEGHISDLFVTIPTRDGTRAAFRRPRSGSPLSPGHHLVFFHPRHPEHALRPDGTEPDFCPPEPFTRRMWVGGKIRWNHDKPLVVGGKATATWEIENVAKKGFEKGSPMVFVNQRIRYRMEGMPDSDVCVDEERSHVYLAHSAKGTKAPREVKDIPNSSDFSFSFTPTSTTLFRFSALIFNAHFNHLDKEFAQQVEGYPERLVHGPLTALMLLDATTFCDQGSQIKSFEYRATNPLIVNRELTFHGSWVQDKQVKVWCVDDEGVVGMTGLIKVA